MSVDAPVCPQCGAALAAVEEARVDIGGEQIVGWTFSFACGMVKLVLPLAGAAAIAEGCDAA